MELAKWVLGVRNKAGDGFAVPVAAAVALGRAAGRAGRASPSFVEGGGSAISTRTTD